LRSPFRRACDQHQKRKAAVRRKAQRIDAIAHPARLHEERAALTAQPRARGQADAFLFGRERNGRHALVRVAQLDQTLVACIGHIRHLAHALRLERAMIAAGQSMPRRTTILIFSPALLALYDAGFPGTPRHLQGGTDMKLYYHPVSTTSRPCGCSSPKTPSIAS